jgi:hypothetical protein
VRYLVVFLSTSKPYQDSFLPDLFLFISPAIWILAQSLITHGRKKECVEFYLQPHIPLHGMVLFRACIRPTRIRIPVYVERAGTRKSSVIPNRLSVMLILTE